jgi:hypothetical protein
MFIITRSQNLLCSCKGHQDATWHHGFTTIINMTQFVQFLDKYIIISEFILIYLNDLKLRIQKYHLFIY